jgi:hypothetical protein
MTITALGYYKATCGWCLLKLLEHIADEVKLVLVLIIKTMRPSNDYRLVAQAVSATSGLLGCKQGIWARFEILESEHWAYNDFCTRMDVLRDCPTGCGRARCECSEVLGGVPRGRSGNHLDIFMQLTDRMT